MHYLDYVPKLMHIASHNMIKMGGVIQGDITQSVLKISSVINCFYLLENLHFSLVYVHVYGTRCWQNSTKVTLKHPSLRSAVVICGWGIYMLIIDPRAFRIQKWESRNHNNIDKEAFFKLLAFLRT